MFHPYRGGACAVLSLVLAACASAPETSITVPLSVAPLPPAVSVERPITGSLFQPDQPATALFTTERRPRTVGDTLKIDISETLAANGRHKSSTERENKIASKGPGGNSNSGVLRSLLNLDATASGSDSFKGNGEAEAGHSVSGRMTATVINVLANGNLVVAGERVVRLTNGATTMRFSGVVDPNDIRSGNVVASADVADARVEAVGSGELGESARRSWLQRVLTDTLRVW